MLGYIDYIVIVVVLLILGLSIGYIVRAKKGGQKCIGCPYAKNCKSKSCNGQNNK